MLAIVTNEHIKAKLCSRDPESSQFDLHEFVLSPLGAFYVPLDPYNPEQVLGQFGGDFTAASSGTEHCNLLTCQPCSKTIVCPLSGIRNQVNLALGKLTACCPEFTTPVSAHTTPYVVSSAFAHQHLQSSSIINDTTHFPGGDARPRVPQQKTLLQFFRPTKHGAS